MLNYWHTVYTHSGYCFHFAVKINSHHFQPVSWHTQTQTHLLKTRNSAWEITPMPATSTILTLYMYLTYWCCAFMHVHKVRIWHKLVLWPHNAKMLYRCCYSHETPGIIDTSLPTKGVLYAEDILWFWTTCWWCVAVHVLIVCQALEQMKKWFKSVLI